MYISLNWVNDFVKLPALDADDLANSFTMTTAEVEGVETTNKHLKAICVAEIKEIEKHPEADKLNLVSFDFGAGELKRVVCGAPNVKVGLKVPYAPLGITLPNGLTLEPKKIRGILSEGMLCSETELGIGEGTSGLMELPADFKVGTSMIDALGLSSDTVLDVDNKSLTHRPDLWGHYGIAREFAAAYELELAKPFTPQWEKELESYFTSATSPIIPIIEGETSCLAYFGLSVDNVSIGATPKIMKDRLEASGLRSINSIVDISNYVMLELGQPLHIFDRDKIKDNKIIIKKAASDEAFTTLDESERKLQDTDTVICDSEKTLVLAGLMGGLNSGVTDETKRLFIEVANWKADSVRKTSTRLGLRSDSSQRFEKSLDSKQCYRTLLRTLELIKEICPEAKVIGRAEYCGEDLSKIETRIIKTSAKRICDTLGKEIQTEKLLSIFKHLDFETQNKNGDFEITLPSFRTTKDLEFEACIIEEVGRMIGFDNIEPVSPTSGIQTTRLSPDKVLQRKIQDFMVMNAHSLEIMTYPLIGQSLLEKASWPVTNEELVLVNSLSKDADRMRPSLVPHALNTISVNAKNYERFNFFEYGRSYKEDSKNFSSERYQLVIGSFDKKKTPFVDLLNTTEKLLNYLNISFDFATDSGKFDNNVIPNGWLGRHPHEFVNIRIMGKFEGAISSVHPLVLRSFKTKGFAAITVIDFTNFHTREVKSKSAYSPISKFPTSSFDCTVIVGRDEEAANTLQALKKLKVKEATDRKIVDVFQLENGNRAVTIRVVFESENQTLDSALLKAAEGQIVSILGDAGYPLKE